MLPAFHLATVQHDELPPTRSKCYWLLPRIFTWGTLALLVLLLVNKNFTYKEMFLAGLFTYGIYDLTNASIFANWDVLFGLADMVWGGILFTTTSYLVNKISK